MLAGALGILQVLLSLRDRATKGGWYHTMSVLPAVDTIQLTQEVGLYSPETVAKIQEHYQFPHMGPEQHVEELLYVVLSGWAKRPEKLKKEYFSTSRRCGERSTPSSPLLSSSRMIRSARSGKLARCHTARQRERSGCRCSCV